MEARSEDRERAVKHWMIPASSGNLHAMHALRAWFKQGHVSRKELTLHRMRSEARDACNQVMT